METHGHEMIAGNVNQNNHHHQFLVPPVPICIGIIAVLTDQQHSVRQLAINALAGLYNLYKETVLVSKLYVTFIFYLCLIML